MGMQQRWVRHRCVFSKLGPVFSRIPHFFGVMMLALFIQNQICATTLQEPVSCVIIAPHSRDSQNQIQHDAQFQDQNVSPKKNSQLHPQSALLRACIQHIQNQIPLPHPPTVACPWDIHHPDFLNLCHRLQQLYFLPKTKSVTPQQVQCAVKSFQRLYKIPETGELDPKTIQALNSDQHILIRALKHAEKKWHTLGPLPPQCFVTNIPAFQMELIKQGQCIWSSKVMVGKLNSRTPTFSGHIYSMVFNPTWIIPRSRYKDFLPYVGQDGYCLNKGCLVQKPGPKNHLGQIKFLTRRSDAIIFHSTHEPELFDHDVRTYSLGCVRVQDFKGMAGMIAQNSSSSVNIDRILDEKKSTEITLKNPFHVYVVNECLWIQDKVLCVYADIYGGSNPTPPLAKSGVAKKKHSKKMRTKNTRINV